MNINELTIGQVRELAGLFSNPLPSSGRNPADDAHWEIGKPYLIRTVTHIDTGILVAVTPQELVLEEAAWIADTGRYAEAVEKAEFGEVEPYPAGKVILGRGAIIDAVQIKKAPRSQK